VHSTSAHKRHANPIFFDRPSRARAHSTCVLFCSSGSSASSCALSCFISSPNASSSNAASPRADSGGKCAAADAAAQCSAVKPEPGSTGVFSKVSALV
jgi:hypothetical protein